MPKYSVHQVILNGKSTSTHKVTAKHAAIFPPKQLQAPNIFYHPSQILKSKLCQEACQISTPVQVVYPLKRLSLQVSTFT